MIMVALGLGALGLMLWAAQRFASARVSGVKAMVGWIGALAGLSLCAMLFLTGRGALAVGALVLAGPALWGVWTGRTPGAPAVGMRRADALRVLGLTDPVSETDVREAWVRLMRTAHPDQGGSDRLAAQINQARDVLLGRK